MSVIKFAIKLRKVEEALSANPTLNFKSLRFLLVRISVKEVLGFVF